MRRTIEVDDLEQTRTLLGTGDCHLRRIRDALGVEIVVRNRQLHIDGPAEAVEKGARIFYEMLRILRNSRHLDLADVENLLQRVQGVDPRGDSLGERGQAAPNAPTSPNGPRPGNGESANGGQVNPLAGRVRAMTEGQHKYLEAIRDHDVVFAIGPAGSGKTYLAVTMAIESLSKNQVNRLILVRPAVEAGEHLGFLPGDLREKVNPYLRPLYDALHDLLSPAQTAKFMERGVIEVAPLAFMRGRTLNSAFVILDEAQNTTPKQMKMFLTRLGRDARVVITGDVTQVDLPDSTISGLTHARGVLEGVEGVAFIQLDRSDIVRHPLVQRIVNAYEKSEQNAPPDS